MSQADRHGTGHLVVGLQEAQSADETQGPQQPVPPVSPGVDMSKQGDDQTLLDGAMAKRRVWLILFHVNWLSTVHDKQESESRKRCGSLEGLPSNICHLSTFFQCASKFPRLCKDVADQTQLCSVSSIAALSAAAGTTELDC